MSAQRSLTEGNRTSPESSFRQLLTQKQTLRGLPVSYLNRYDASRPLGTSMKRREFITLLGGAAAPAILCPRAARSQPTSKVARIGFLDSATAVGSAQSVEALRTGLR